MKSKSVLLFCLFVMSCPFGHAQLPGRVANILNDFGSQINIDVTRDDLHGSISVAVVKDDKLIWAKAFGYARPDRNIVADTNTIYRIGSITKTFTSTLMMMLVEEGKISLDDPAEKYVPEVKKIKGYPDAAVFTLRQLASHTSGLEREPEVSFTNVGATDQWQKKVIEVIPDTKFIGRPGGQFLYSNIGFAILGLALERAAGEPFMQMIDKRIIKPLHMSNTFFDVPKEKKNLLAYGTENSNNNTKINNRLPVEELDGRGYRVPNGGLFSTPSDLAKFAASMIKAPHLLKPGSFNAMQQVQTGGKLYGLGLMVSSTSNFIGHNGSTPGYTSEMLIDRASGYAVILTRNYNFGATNLDKIAFELLRKL